MKGPLGIIAVALVALAAVLIVVPNLLPPRTEASQNPCITSLRRIARAKDDWVQRRQPNPVPTLKDLFGPNEERWPYCPAGGKYDPGPIGRDPTCSIGTPSHAIPHNPR